MEIDAVRLGIIEQAANRTKQAVWESKEGYDEVSIYLFKVKNLKQKLILLVFIFWNS